MSRHKVFTESLFLMTCLMTVPTAVYADEIPTPSPQNHKIAETLLETNNATPAIVVSVLILIFAIIAVIIVIRSKR